MSSGVRDAAEGGPGGGGERGPGGPPQPMVRNMGPQGQANSGGGPPGGLPGQAPPPQAQMPPKQQQEQQSAGTNYLGKRISLTTKSEIRYEGTLCQIDPSSQDPKSSTVKLEHVRSFGSEGRPRDGPQIPPSNQIYSYIVFRVTDIKGLEFIPSPPMRAPQAPAMPSDPAIVSSGYEPPRSYGGPSPPSYRAPYGGMQPQYGMPPGQYGMGQGGQGDPRSMPSGMHGDPYANRGMQDQMSRQYQDARQGGQPPAVATDARQQHQGPDEQGQEPPRQLQNSGSSAPQQMMPSRQVESGQGQMQSVQPPSDMQVLGNRRQMLSQNNRDIPGQRGWGPPPTASASAPSRGVPPQQIYQKPPAQEQRPGVETDKQEAEPSSTTQADAGGAQKDSEQENVPAQAAPNAWHAGKAWQSDKSVGDGAARPPMKPGQATSQGGPAQGSPDVTVLKSSPPNAWAGSSKGAWDKNRPAIQPVEGQRDTNDRSAPRAAGGGAWRGSGGGGGGGNRNRMVVPKEDFDFEAMNEKFDKVGMAEDGEIADDMPKFDKKYDAKKSFFDDLATERSSADSRRRDSERKNYETFGEVTVRRRYGQRGGRRGGGGGAYRGGNRSAGSYRTGGNYERNDVQRNGGPNQVQRDGAKAGGDRT